MHRLLFILLLSFSAFKTAGQGTKIEITTCKELGVEGTATLYEVGFKVLSGNIEGTGRDLPLALPLANGLKAFAYLNTYDAVATGKNAPSPALLKVHGQKIQTGKTLVSHDLITIKIPSPQNFEFQTNMAFLGEEPLVFFGEIKRIKGFSSVGDEIAYTNARGQQGKAKILDFEVAGGYKTNVIFEGIPDNLITIKVQALNKTDFSDSKVTPASATTPNNASTGPSSNTMPVAAHKTKSIPVEAVLENKEVKITVHQLVKFNPDDKDRRLDVFPVDYTLDYYIVDATFENKTARELDMGEYLLRFNFFSSDGKSADEYLRVFKAEKNTTDQVQRDADKIDTNVFGGTSKIPLAAVMVKYEMSIPNYDTQYKTATNTLNKPFAPGQKTRSINATIMGVPPTYKIEGLGTWSGTFFDKKQLLFVPIKR